jgi:hypothetical protein
MPELVPGTDTGLAAAATGVPPLVVAPPLPHNPDSSDAIAITGQVEVEAAEAAATRDEENNNDASVGNTGTTTSAPSTNSDVPVVQPINVTEMSVPSNMVRQKCKVKGCPMFTQQQWEMEMCSVDDCINMVHYIC